jgi:hypothetical protein
MNTPEDVALPAELLMQFLHDKPILFTNATTKQVEEGKTDVVIFGDGKCHFSIQRPARAQPGPTWHSHMTPLSQEQVSAIRFDSSQGDRGKFLILPSHPI